MADAHRLIRLLLRCYPGEFRDEYAREMAQVYRDRARDEPTPRVWLDFAIDLARTAPKEHAHVLAADLRYAVRLVRRAPLFTAAVVLTVALGIGATTTIFTVVNAVLLRPLPFGDPDRLVWVAEKNDRLNLPTFGASVLNYLSWRERTRTLDLAAIGFGSYNLSGGGDPEQCTGGQLSPSLLPVLGLQPLAGRNFAAGEDAPGAPRVVLISEGLWKRRFAADPALVGATIRVNGLPHTVVGIAPPALAVLTGGDVWTPLTIDPAREIRLNHVINAVARVRPGVTLEQARREMDGVAADVGKQYPEVKDWGTNLVRFRDWLVAPSLRTGLIVLLGAVGCVLLITCANVANLLLARAAARQREMAVRTAMGASRARLLRQLLVESVGLSCAGGALGIGLAVLAVRAIAAMLPPNTLPVPNLPVDATVLVVATLATVAVGIGFGLLPAIHSARPDFTAVLKGARGDAGNARAKLRRALAAAELAVATVLLVGAGLLGQTLLHLQRVPLGFSPDHLLTFQVSLPPAKYPNDGPAQAFYRQLEASLRARPDVLDSAVSSGVPFGNGTYTTTPVMPLDGSILPPNTAVPIDWRSVSDRFFRTLQIPLLRGRDFTDADAAVGPAAVAIVSRATAEKFWGAADPLGHRIRMGGRELRIVGVVGDVHNSALNQEAPAVYIPIASRIWSVMDVAVRTRAEPTSIVASVRLSVRALDPEVPLANVRTMDEWIGASAAQPRLNASLFAGFAAAALLLAAVGIYGVIAYSVAQRTREMGVRLALGAPRHAVMRLVVGEGVAMALAGVGAGSVAAVAASRALATLVFGVDVHDVPTFTIVAALLSAVAIAASAVPARRASRIDPIVALRDE